MSDVPHPSRIFETLNAFQRSAALRGAIDLDLFTVIGEGALRLPEIARRCNADERALRILCDFLVVDQFLTKSGTEYALTPLAATYLDRRSPQDMSSTARFMHSPHLRQAFDDVAGLVRRGGTLLDNAGTTQTDYAGWVDFARSMVPLMRAPAEFIGRLAAEQCPGPIRVLDIAAGHGLFGIKVAELNPAAQIVALDWGAVLDVALENASRAGISDRYTLLPGDALTIDYGEGYDLVLITNFLHHFDPAVCAEIMEKVVGSLSAEGLVLTLEFIPNEDRVSPAQPATFAFTMLGTTPGGDAYTYEEYCTLWRVAGLHQHQLLDVPHSTQRVIVSRR